MQHISPDGFKTVAPDAFGGLTIGQLFERPNRGNWGTRGDVYLWEELRERFADTPVPTGEYWEFGLSDALRDAFKVLTEHDLYEWEPFYLKRLDPGHGMSAGVVSPKWWAETGFGIIKDRAWGIILRANYPLGV